VRREPLGPGLMPLSGGRRARPADPTGETPLGFKESAAWATRKDAPSGPAAARASARAPSGGAAATRPGAPDRA
jgi:hypothetical protein